MISMKISVLDSNKGFTLNLHVHILCLTLELKNYFFFLVRFSLDSVSTVNIKLMNM